MTQTATQAAPLTETETQNRPDLLGVQVERIDPSILQLVAFFFPAAPFEGLKFLALLSKEKQRSFFFEVPGILAHLLPLLNEGGQP